MARNIVKTEPTSRPASKRSGVTVNGTPIEKNGAVGHGGFEGADRLGKELATWRAPITSADGALGRNDKANLDARGKDMLRNNGPMLGTENTHKDSIVGLNYRLNAAPVTKVLRVIDKRFDDTWAEEFQQEIEAKFGLWAESEDRWVDAARRNTFTDLIRLGIGCFFSGGEVVASFEWLRGQGRMYSTALQMIDADRLSNPNEAADTNLLRRGIEMDKWGAPIAAHIRNAHPRDNLYADIDQFTWKRVAFYKRWGRLQMLHIIDQKRPHQTRGIADMVAILKETRMGKRFHDISLQNAIVQATYAATIESELPPHEAFDAIGAGTDSTNPYLSMLEMIAGYSRGGRNVEIDGVKIPYLFPGSKLNMRPAQVGGGGVGASFEESLNRHMSTALGVSYEEYTNDYSKTNYSSARASAGRTRRAMQNKKRMVADRMANSIYTNWMEESIDLSYLETMKPFFQKNPEIFYEPYVRDALCKATWIGASNPQVDEMKETQAAVLRINSGLSTLEKECARLGEDYRDVLTQAAREKKQKEELGLDFNTAPTKSGTLSSQRGKKTAEEPDGDEDE